MIKLLFPYFFPFVSIALSRLVGQSHATTMSAVIAISIPPAAVILFKAAINGLDKLFT